MQKSFTKSILKFVVAIYYIGALVGIGLTLGAAFFNMSLGIPIDSSMFMVLAGYLGTPTAIAIAFYAWKSKAENLLKIKNATPETIQTLANMGGQT